MKDRSVDIIRFARYIKTKGGDILNPFGCFQIMTAVYINHSLQGSINALCLMLTDVDVVLWPKLADGCAYSLNLAIQGT